MNKITKKEFPFVFTAIRDLITDDTYNEYRHGSTFYTKSFVEITEDDITFDPEFAPFVGTWETNQYVRSGEDVDWSEITELIRVEEITIVTETKKWVPVKD